MLTHYMEIIFICIGVYMLVKGLWAPIGYVCGALIVVLSIIKIFGA